MRYVEFIISLLINMLIVLQHILSRKHRKFAENDENWLELDSLLSQLKRPSKCSVLASDEEEDMW